MKRYFILTLLAALLVTATMPATAQRHRHHQVAQQTTAASDTAVDKGIEAFSDTTSSVAAATPTSTYTVDDDDDDMPVGKMLDLWAATVGFGVGGIILAVTIVLVVFLIIISPFIILALIIRMLIRRHNDNVGMAQQSAPTPQPVVQTTAGIDSEYREKGVKNTSIGAGLVIMGWITDSTTIAAIGALVVCYGLGQLYLSHRRGAGNDNADNND